MRYLNIKNWLAVLAGVTFLFLQVQAQQIPDSLLQKSYKDLRDQVWKYSEIDTIIGLQYASAYLRKAATDRDTLNMARGYYYKTINYTDDRIRFLFYDSIINFSKNLKRKNFPTLAYYDRGSIYKDQLEFERALDDFSKAVAYNLGSIKDHIDFLLNCQIASLKIRIDNNKEALDLLKENWAYIIKRNYKDSVGLGSERDYYDDGLYNLGNTYRKLNKLDSAEIYNKLGLNDHKINKESIGYGRFLILDGALKIRKKQYKKSKNQLIKGINLLEECQVDMNTLAAGYFFLGKNYSLTKDSDQAVLYFKKLDSLFKITNDIIPEFTEGYRYILDYYKKKENSKQELMYTTRLIDVDSALKKQYKNLNAEIAYMFDNPMLKRDVERITAQVGYEQKIAKTYYLILSSLIVLILSIAIYQYKKRILYKRRFLHLVNNDNQGKVDIISVPSSNDIPIDIPERTVQEVLEKLNTFEKQIDYTDPNMSLNNLSMILETNSSYLSKIINHYKKESFSSYIKKLRVNYGFNKLKTDVTFRKYTIKAIAMDCGFKTAESFSKTFYTTYGIYPSYFIKQFEKSIS